MIIEAYRTALQLFLMASLVACERSSESNSTQTGGGEDSLTEAEFVVAYQHQSCLNLSRCCGELGTTLDESRCSALFANAGVGSAAAAYNPVDGTQCIAEMEASTRCWLTLGAACGRVYSGTRAPGEMCTADTDCAAPPGGNATCDQLLGVCLAGVRGHLGDACQRSCRPNNFGEVECPWGPASSPNGSTAVNCHAEEGLICGNQGRCVALAGLGQPCENDTSCELSLFCRIGAGTTGGICQSRGTLGSPCDQFNAPCINSAYCQAGICAARKANGDRCLTNDECLGVCTCGVGTCPGTGVCADPNTVRATIDLVSVLRQYCAA